MGAGLNFLRIAILGYFAALFATAFYVAYLVLAAGAENPECGTRHCPRYERVGDWMEAISGDALFAASMSFTGVVVVGLVIFAIPWVITLGGFAMLTRRSYSLAIVAAILSLTNCNQLCCVLSIPVGIWALIVLFQPDVKASFR